MSSNDKTRWFRLVDGRVVTAERDDCPPNPVEDYADVEIHVWSPRLSSPTENPVDDPHDFIGYVADDLPDDVRKTLPDEPSRADLDGVAALFDLYYMDHSDFAYSMGDFGDPWDSGQVGYVWLPERYLAGCAGGAREERLESARKWCEAVVDEYDAWAHGNGWLLSRGGDDDGCVSVLETDSDPLEAQIVACYGSKIDEELDEEPEGPEEPSPAVLRIPATALAALARDLSDPQNVRALAARLDHVDLVMVGTDAEAAEAVLVDLLPRTMENQGTGVVHA